jgi:hypothetical protein
MKTIKVNNLANFEFWLSVFKQKTKSEQEVIFNELHSTKNSLDTERNDKIKAIQFLLK